MSYVKQDEGAGGDTYNLLANQDGPDVNLNLDAAASPDSQVKFKAGTNITLTEAGTNSISIDAAGGGSPGGSNGQVQYNNGGSFGGDAAFTFDDTAGAKQVVVEDSSTADLVRITQTGTGDALVVEDSANPDATPVRVSNSGAVIVGTTSSSLGKLHVSGHSGNRNITDPAGQANIIARLDSSASAIELLNFPPESGNLLIYQPFVDGEFTIIRRDGITNNLETSMVISTEDTIKIGLGGKNYGTAGQVLTSGGPSGAVSWTTVSGGGGTSFAQYADMRNLSPTAYPFVQPACIAPFSASCTVQSVSTISDDIHFSPMLFTNNVNIGKLWLANGGTTNPFEIGVYETDSKNLPTNKIVSATVASPASNTTVTVNIASTALTANEMYWIAVCNTTTGANLSCLNVGSPPSFTSTSATVNRGTIAITTGTINALPASITQSDLTPLIRPPSCGVWLV
jgi:hypothetical protein